MKKRGYIGRLAALAMVLCLVTMSLTAGTLARYASSTDGDAKAVVAKWDIEFKKGDGTGDAYTGSDAFVLNLSDTDQVNANLVKADRVAPGTDGSFAFQVNAGDTEVAYTYTIEMDLSGTGLDKAPIVFAKANDFAVPANILTKGTDGKVKLTGNVMVADLTTNATKTIDVFWKWDSKGLASLTDPTKTSTGVDDAGDTNLVDTSYGLKAATNELEYTIPVTITATQLTTVPAGS